MALPNFICIGAQKCGTTTLHDVLNQHTDIFLPQRKETKFFFHDNEYKKGLAYYQSEFFGTVKDEQAIGEIDPEYLYFEDVPQRIYKSLGKDVKLIVVMRNPVDRAYSHYLMSQRRGFETESFPDAIKLENERIKSEIFNQNHFSYISRGLYSHQIKEYLKYFDKEQMKFYIFEEDIKSNLDKTIKDILQYLEVDDTFKIKTDLKSNPSSKPKFRSIRDLVYKKNKILSMMGRVVIPSKKLRWKFKDWIDKKNQKPFKYPKLDERLKKELLDRYFMEDIKELEKLIDKDISIWYENG